MPAHTRAQRSLGLEETRRAVDGLTVTVPGSCGNLGSGFDALAVAVQLYTRVTVRRVRDDLARSQVLCTFEGVALDGEDYVARSITTLASREGLDFPSLELAVETEIPMQAGLGSSAAATVAGLLIVQRMTGAAALDLASEAAALEGHPDNVAASLVGGLASGTVCDDGRVIVMSTPWPESVRLVAITPAARLQTSDARRVLPPAISRADAVFNLQRTALLVQAVATGRADLLREAVRDRWHQPYRTALVPALAEALAFEHEDLLGICLSGAGPTVLAFAQAPTGRLEEALASLYSRLGVPCRIRTLDAHNGPPRVVQNRS
ncbi:MAG TPA: homoserine kinase [Methylomirabilota bacterium]